MVFTFILKDAKTTVKDGKRSSASTSSTTSKDMKKIKPNTSSPTNVATTISESVSSARPKGVKTKRRPKNKG